MPSQKMSPQSWPQQTSSAEVPWWTSCRLCLAIVGFFGFLHIYAQRVGMSVAIVCMVNQTALHLMRHDSSQNVATNGSAVDSSYSIGAISGIVNQTGGGVDVPDSQQASCQMQQPGSDSSTFENGEYIWDKGIQGHILGSFFYGYLISQVPAGMLAERFGGKWVFFIFISVSTVATIFMPLAARVGYIFVIILRVISGIGSGAAYPVMHAIWSKWSPPDERSKLTNITYAGAWMGNVVTMPLAGLLCKYGFDGGWSAIFYIIGASSVVWLVVWVVMVSDSPTNHKRISQRERDYIANSLQGQLSLTENRKDQVPWLQVFSSGPVWACVFGGICTDWGLYTFLTNIPTYMHEVLKFDIQSNGLFSALPFVGLWVNMCISPTIADKLISSRRLKLGTVRKLMHGIGCVGAAIFMVALAFVDCTQPLLAVGLLICGITITGCTYSGFMVSPMDIAPRYAGTILGLANGLAASTGFAAPYTVAVLTPNQTYEEWQRVFFIAAGIYVFGAIFFGVFASGEVQPWAKEKEEPLDDTADELKQLDGEDMHSPRLVNPDDSNAEHKYKFAETDSV